MRAAVLLEPGTTPELGTRPDPVVGPGRSLVRVAAAPVVPLDVLCASGTSYFGRPATPYVPGVQGVGVVERSETVPVGERVFFATSAGMAPGDGSLAERCAVRDEDLVRLPADADVVGDAALAALGLSSVAAWASLAWRARVGAGDRVVVLGCGGAVGQVAVAAARALGAARVVGVCRGEESAARARTAGADAVVTTAGAGGDSRALTATLLDAAQGPVDVVLDPVFGPVAEAALGAMADGGRLVNLGGSAGDTATVSSALLRSRSITLMGHTNNALTPARRAEALTAVVSLAAQGLAAVAHQVVPLSEIATAWVETAAGRAAPRWVLVP